jgi:YD repeat-containing protein
VQTNQILRLKSDQPSWNWFSRVNEAANWTAGPTGTNVFVYTTPTSVTEHLTFDRIQIAIGSGATPDTTTTRYFDLCEGPVAGLWASSSLRNPAAEEAPLRPDEWERDDPPLGLPFLMPGANRDGFGTMRLARASSAGGPANLVSLFGPGVFVDTAGKLGVRTPGPPYRGLGPFAPFQSQYHTGLYFNYDFGKSRTIGLTRVLYQNASSHVAIVRGDGRRNTYRWNGATWDGAASLGNTLTQVGGKFQETTPTGRVYYYNAVSGGVATLDKVVDRYGSPVYYLYDTTPSARLQKIQGPSGSSGLVPYLSYDGNGLLARLVLEDASGNAAANRTTYFAYDGNRNLTQITWPELCTTSFEYNVPERVSAVTDAQGFRWYFAYDGNNRTQFVCDALNPAQPSYYGYDTTAGLTTLKDRAGKITYFQYNAFGEPITVYNLGTAADYYTYDGDGNLATTTNRLGNQWAFTFDGRGNRIAVTDPQSDKSYFAFDGQDLVQLYTDPLLRTTYLSYDGNRNRTARRDALANTTYWAYQTAGSQPNAGLLQYRKDRLGNFTYFHFDATGNNDSVVDALGFKTYFQFNSAGERYFVFDARSNATYLSYDLRGRVKQVTDPYLNTKLFTYDSSCNPTSEVDELGHTTYHTYDGNTNRTKTVRLLADGSFLGTYFRYDVEERLAGQKDVLQHETYWLYDGLGRRAKQVDALGNETYWVYDDAHELTIEQPPAQSGGATRLATYYTYDVVGRRIQTLDAAELLTYVSYDAKGNVSFTNVDQGWGRQPWSSSPYGGERATTYFAYDSLDRRTRVTDAYGNHSYWNYDAEGNVTSTLNAASPTRLATYFDYDALNRQMHGSDNLHFATTYMGYDAVGNVVRRIDALGYESYFTFDSLNRAQNVQGFYGTTGSVDSKTYYAYDAASNRVEVRVDNLENNLQNRISRSSYFEYDFANRLRRAIDAEASSSATRGFTYHDYDAVGNKKLVVDQEGRPTYFTFDVLNRESTRLDASQDTWTTIYDGRSAVTNRIDPEGRTQYFAYDLQGRVLAQADALGNQAYTFYDAKSQRTHSVNARGYSTLTRYDQLGRQTYQIDALSGVRYYAYDSVGNQTQRSDELGQTTYLTYDLLNRLQSSKDQAAAVTYLGYDARGSVVKRVDADGRSTYYVYDGARRLTQQTFQNPVSGETADKPIYFAYDLVGNAVTVADDTISTANYFAFDRLDRLTQKSTLAGTMYLSYDKSSKRSQVTYPDKLGTPSGFTGVYYTFDANGRLSTAAAFDGAGNRPASYSYDKAGLPKIRTLNGTSVMAYYFYDGAGRLSQLANRGPAYATLISYFSYGLDANGNTTSITREGGLNTYYTFDALDRLTSERWKGASGLVYGYNYNFDAASNRSNRTNETTNKATYYTYNSLNLMTVERQKQLVDDLSQFAYDSSQRMIRQDYNLNVSPASYYFTYDQRNEIKRIHNQAFSPATDRYFAYDGAGERVMAIDGGNPTYWTYDGNKLVSVRDSAGTVTQFCQNAFMMPGNVIEYRNADGVNAYPAFDQRANEQNIQGGPNETQYRDTYGLFLAGSTNFTDNRLPFLSASGLAKLSLGFFVTSAGWLYLPGEGVFTIAGRALRLVGFGLGGIMADIPRPPFGGGQGCPKSAPLIPPGQDTPGLIPPYFEGFDASCNPKSITVNVDPTNASNFYNEFNVHFPITVEGYGLTQCKLRMLRHYSLTVYGFDKVWRAGAAAQFKTRTHSLVWNPFYWGAGWNNWVDMADPSTADVADDLLWISEKDARMNIERLHLGSRLVKAPGGDFYEAEVVSFEAQFKIEIWDKSSDEFRDALEWGFTWSNASASSGPGTYAGWLGIGTFTKPYGISPSEFRNLNAGR